MGSEGITESNSDLCLPTSEVCLQRRSPATTGRRRDPYLLFIVNGLIVELLPVDRATHRGGARFAIRGNGALAAGDYFPALHRRELVGVIVHDLVSHGVPRHVPFCLVGFAVSLSLPNPVPWFSILVYAL